MAIQFLDQRDRQGKAKAKNRPDLKSCDIWEVNGKRSWLYHGPRWILGKFNHLGGQFREFSVFGKI